MKQLTAREANRLALQQQVILVQLLEVSLSHSFNGKNKLFGKEVGLPELQQAKNVLTELDRKQQIYDSSKYEKLPYYNSNGSNVPKTKVHVNNESQIVEFVEAKDGASMKSVNNKLTSKSLILKQINKKQKNMATKKAAAKKASKKTAVKKASKKATNRSYAPKTGTIAQKIRDAYGTKLNPKFNKAEFAQKTGIPYHLVYGCITKHEAALKAGGKKKAA